MEPALESPVEPEETTSEAQPSPEKPKRKSAMQAMRGVSIEKWLCWTSMSVAGLMFVLFGLDLVLRHLIWGEGVGTAVDVIIVLSSILLGYLSWNAARDLR
jgi:hypothetical protein